MSSYTVTKPSWFSSKQEIHDANGKVIGKLTMLKKMSYKLAEAQTSDRTLLFGYEGWNMRTLFIRDSAGKDIAAVQSTSWWKREVTITIDDQDYAWKQKNWWGTHCGWFTADGREIMEFRRQWWSCKLDIDSRTPMDQTKVLLLLFGTYLMKLQEMDAAVTGA